VCQCAVVTCVKAWLDHVQIKSGPVFRRIENTGQVGERSLHPQEVARILQRIAQRMNAESVTWPDLRLGAHSTLIGAAHDMVAAGIDLTSIMHAGGWNDPKMPRYSTRELAAMDSGMARLGGGLGTELHRGLRPRRTGLLFLPTTIRGDSLRESARYFNPRDTWRSAANSFFPIADDRDRQFRAGWHH